MPPTRLTLLIPELIWPEPADRQTLDRLLTPALGALFARGHETRTTAPDNSADALIAAAFGLADDVPYAPLRLLGEGHDPGTDHWACADPVHLRFHQERLILADGARIAIEEVEAGQLVRTLNDHFADAGEFRAAAADRWYLRLAAPADFRTPPLSEMAGRRLDRQLPEEASTAWLRKLLNEAQMLLHTHAANAAREESGRMTINSLWLWGPGRLPTQLARRFDSVFADAPLARGLARVSGAACHGSAGSFVEWQAAQTGNTSLVIIADLLRAVQYEDPDAWRQALLDLETRWFAPLAAAVRAGRVELDLQSSTIYGLLGWQVKRGDLWRFWRRPTTIGAVAARLADTPA
ncbi:MAG: hypothetical protein L6Q60_08510 [Rhodocyclaceae bacterium]|nr:hypothetical protein [Rhodocyclaceae bacterium]